MVQNSINNASERPVTHNRMALGDTVYWLSEGVQDIRHTPAVSLSYGIVITLIVYAVIQGGSQIPILSLSFISAFLVVSPLLAAGLYHASRRREQGKQTLLRDALESTKFNGWALMTSGIILGILCAAWGRIAGISVALSMPAVGSENITANLFSWEAIFTPTPDGWLFVALPLVLGFAATAFAIAVIALPMLYHRKLDPITAMIESVRITRKNWTVMLVWGLIISLAVTAGILFSYLSLVIIMPLLAHASWHCYRQMTG